MSYFFLMGQGGSALGPVLAGLLLDSANPAGTSQVTLLPMFALGLLVVPVVGLMAASMAGRPRTVPDPTTPQPAAQASRVSLPIKALIILGVMVTLRGLAQPGSVAFIPRLFQQKGWDASEYGLITSLFWVASGIAGILFGQLADRYDRRWVIAGSLLLSVPALFFLPIAESRPMVFGLAIAAGGLTGGSHSVIVALAQSLIPGRKGFVSGAALGFIFGAGAIGGLLIGGLSDRVGLGTTFQIVAGVTILAGLLALLLPVGRQVSAAIPPEMETALTRAR